MKTQAIPGPPALTRAFCRLAWAPIVLLAACTPSGDTMPLAPEELLSLVRSSHAVQRTDAGVEFEVAGTTLVRLERASVRALELAVSVDTPLRLGWAPATGVERGAFAIDPIALLPGRRHVRLDFAPCPGWTPESGALLFLLGAGRLVIERASLEPSPADPVVFRRTADRALRWRPEPLGDATINRLTPPYWDTAERWLPDSLALLAAATAAVTWLAFRLLRRPAGPRPLLVAALVAFAGYDAFFLLRMRPLWSGSFRADPEARLREHSTLDPAAGALAALGRRELAPEARVGVVANDWLGAQLLCYYLWPRRAVILDRGALEGSPSARFQSLSGIDELALEELDVLAVSGLEVTLPAGFRVFASQSPRHFLARRE